MIDFTSRHLWLATLLLAGGCISKEAAQFGEAHSGAEAWKTADDMTAHTSATETAIQKAKAFSEENIANAETTAYKRRVCRVEGRTLRVTFAFDQGSLERAGRQLDIAIQGDGFLRVKTGTDRGDGFAYTRNGDMFRNDNGDLTVGMGDGLRLDPPINIPTDATDITISSSGLVQIMMPGQVAKQNIGQLLLYRFASPERLDCDEPTLFYESKASGPPIENKPNESGAGQLIQGFLEGSNVDVVREMRRIEYLDRWRAAALDKW